MNGFYKIIVLVICALLTSCGEDDAFDTPVVKGQEQITSVESSKSRQVTEQQVLKFMDMLHNRCVDDCTSGLSKASKVEKRLNNIQYVISESGDTLMYVLNYADDMGYMILSADKKEFPILAMSDTSNINLKEISSNSAFAYWLNEKVEIVSKEISTPLDSLPDDSIWKDIDDDSCTISVELVSDVSLSKKKKTTYELEEVTRESKQITGRMYKWGQVDGYNYNAKSIDGVRCPIGCAAVAIGLVCVANGWPYNYQYYLMPGKLPENCNYQTAISLMLRDIADKIPNYVWGKNVSGTNSEDDILRGLKNVGYEDAKVSDFSTELAWQEISSGSPIVLSGCKVSYVNGVSAHVWFADGFRTDKYKFVKKRGSKILKTWYESYDALLMNFGDKGNGDGWYYSNNSWLGYNNRKKIYTGLHRIIKQYP